MNYTFLVVSQKTGRADILLTTDNDDAATEACAALREISENEESVTKTLGEHHRHPAIIPARRGAKGRRVIVVGLEEEYEGPLKKFDAFDSAAGASAALKYTHNAVALSLGGALRAGQQTATLRGVALQYEDTIGGREV